MREGVDVGVGNEKVRIRSSSRRVREKISGKFRSMYFSFHVFPCSSLVLQTIADKALGHPHNN